jgi:hypothetical protein
MDWESNLPGVQNLFGGDEAEKQQQQQLQQQQVAGRTAAATAADPAVSETRVSTESKTAPLGQPATSAATVATMMAPTAAATAATAATVATASAAASAPSEREPGDKASLSTRVRAFLDKAQEKLVSDVRNRLDSEIMLYDAILDANKRATAASNLLGGPAEQANGLKSLAELGDGRFLSGGLQLCISAKKTVSTSFDTNWKCLRCGQHKQEEAFKIRGVADSYSPRQVVVIADQSFPACLPTDGQHDCYKIIIVENCSLEDGTVEFLKRLGNRRVPKGTVILMFSAAHLVNVGLSQYIQDFLEASKKICSTTGRETICLPLPAFIMGGTDNMELIRAAYELTGWALDFYQDRDNNIADSYSMMWEVMDVQAEGEKQLVETRRVTLPANNPNGKRVWVSGGSESKAMPCVLKPATTPLETRLIKCLTGELRTKFVFGYVRVSTCPACRG